MEFFPLFDLPAELQEIIVSYSSIEWRCINSEYKKISNCYLLLDARFKLVKEDKNVMEWASENNYFEIVKLLLADKRVDPSTNNNSAISYASKKGHTEIVKLLLNDKRVDPSTSK